MKNKIYIFFSKNLDRLFRNFFKINIKNFMHELYIHKTVKLKLLILNLQINKNLLK